MVLPVSFYIIQDTFIVIILLVSVPKWQHMSSSVCPVEQQVELDHQLHF